MATSEPTPCGVMFDVLKRRGQIKHNELAEIVLSGRPLADGRSAISRAGDRSWVSRFIVHAPVGTLQPRYFADYGASALRVTSRLRSRRGRALMTDARIIDLVRGEDGRAMDGALAACHQDATLYRNALERLATAPGHTDGERAEALMVLFIAAGCTADAKVAVAYTMDCARVAYEMRTSTPSSVPASGAVAARDPDEGPRPIGLLRVKEGFVAGAPRWIDPERGAVIGALALGPDDVTDVASDVSAEHARLSCGDAGDWQVEDLGSRNGTVLVDGVTGEEHPVAAGETMTLRPGDELRLGASTTFAVIR